MDTNKTISMFKDEIFHKRQQDYFKHGNCNGNLLLSLLFIALTLDIAVWNSPSKAYSSPHQQKIDLRPADATRVRTG